MAALIGFMGFTGFGLLRFAYRYLEDLAASSSIPLAGACSKR